MIIQIDETKKAEIHNELMRAKREEAYKTESDPLFYKWQRDEVEKAVWLTKVQEIRERYPYDT
jgi:hypothetical protein